MEEHTLTVKFIVLLFFTMFSGHIPAVKSHTHGPLAPALYVFGDSLVDSGNNNLLPTLAKANFLPYGVNFSGGPTGRFTNGRTVVDFIAEFLRLPLAPPYLSVRGIARQSGMNYASGSCGILPDTGKATGKCLSLSEQIHFFKTTIEVELANYYTNSGKLSKYLSQSVFVISIGSNDYLNNYLLKLSGTRRHYSPQSYAKLLVTQLSMHLKRLYVLGARKIVVFEVGPIGCIPSITRTYIHNGKCVEEINQMAMLFNNRLANMVKKLRSTLQGSKITIGRVLGLTYNTIMNPSTYGLKDTSNPCCITWANGTSACIPGLAACHYPDRHFMWDGYHLTEAIYRIVGSRCINDSSICSPYSIKELLNL